MSARRATGAATPALATTALKGPSAFVAASNIATTSASTATSPLQRDRTSARPGDGRDDLVGGVGVRAIIDADRPAASAGGEGDGAADAARAAGDQNDLGHEPLTAPTAGGRAD